MRTGVIAKKVGMTRLFQEDGRHVPVTVLALEDCQVVSHRTADRDGYVALQVGSGEAKQKNVAKPQREHFAKAQVPLKKKVAEFRVETEEALSMLDGIKAAEMLRGVRGADPVDRDALAGIIGAVSNLIADFPEIQEIDLNPIFATKNGATAVDALISVDFRPKKEVFRPSQEEILKAMQRISHPRSVMSRRA